MGFLGQSAHGIRYLGADVGWLTFMRGIVLASQIREKNYHIPGRVNQIANKNLTRLLSVLIRKTVLLPPKLKMDYVIQNGITARQSRFKLWSFTTWELLVTWTES